MANVTDAGDKNSSLKYQLGFSRMQKKTKLIKKQDCLLIKSQLPANVCIQLRVVTSGHVTKTAVTPFNPM